MSYLDLPRVNFGGIFQASPSTLNNTPNNYDPANWTPELTELYWAPNSDGIMDLKECKVSAVLGDDGTAASDSLTGQQVFASYTNAPPKLVDLDPMQQNTSELWGMLLQVGDPAGPFVRGTFEPISFNGIWGNAQGANAPRSSASGSAVYQSSLTNLVWNVGDSAVLKALQAQSPQRLSVRMVVNAHNNAPQNYLFNSTTFAAMTSAGVPKAVVDQIQVLADYRQGADSQPGLIPTSSYVNFQLRMLLGQQVAKQYSETILQVTEQPYTPITPYNFNHGQIVGTVGPAGADEPTYYVPSRVLAPPASGGSCFFAAAKLRSEDAAVTVDLGNSLPVELPGQAPWPEKLGTLSLAYESPPGSGTFVSIVDDIPYDAASGLMTTRAGILDGTGLTPDQVSAIAGAPLVLLGTPGGASTVLLRENPQGLSLRADQFVFRMNPGVETSPTFPRGETATANVYVRKFGQVQGTEGLQVTLHLLDEAAAIKYTRGTLGTSGTAGIKNLSIPQDALSFSPITATVNAQGVATFEISATNPGNPRGSVDGQIYFVRYDFDPAVPGYVGDNDDLLSFQVYEQVEVENPTWANSIGSILGQYGQLYPVMAAFGLGNQASVIKNHEIIRKVLKLDFPDPLHMPVTRDMSESRRNLILQWMDDGMT